MFQRLLQRLLDGNDLTGLEAERAMDLIMSGEATAAQIGAYLAALRMKGETVEEIAGSARAMRAHADRVISRRQGLVDTCGTGGDGSHTFNISTVAALVTAAAGVPVAKHGNRSVSSRCGSADVLEALGVHIDLPAELAGKCLDQVGIAFLFAPRLHSAMRHAIGPRRELGVRTIFNLLGPLTNPAGAEYQLLGVYHRDLVEPVAQVLAQLGIKRALVVHGHPGLDEISLCGETVLVWVEPDQIRREIFHPSSVGMEEVPLSALLGGDREENADIARRILAGERGPKRDAVLVNAAGALAVAGAVDSLAAGIELAAEAIDSGRAMALLDELVSFTQACRSQEVAG